MSNGAKQHQTISPCIFHIYILYSVYVYDLSNASSSITVDYYINSLCLNHVIYADDNCIFALASFRFNHLKTVYEVFTSKISKYSLIFSYMNISGRG